MAGAQLAAHFDSVEVGKAEVEKPQIEITLGRFAQRGSSGAAPRDLVAVGFQAVGEHLADCLVVLDEQQLRHSGNPFGRRHPTLSEQKPDNVVSVHEVTVNCGSPDMRGRETEKRCGNSQVTRLLAQGYLGIFVGMAQREWTRYRRGVPWMTRAATAVACVAAVMLTLPTVAYADPEPPPPPPAPADPGAPPADPDAVPAPPPDPARVNVDAGGFSYDVPAGWTVGDASKVSYGQAVLMKTPDPGAPPPTDTAILLGKLDLKLFAGAEPDNTKAAIRLASDMGEFYMPFPGTRINQQTEALNAGGIPGAAAYYEVKFTDPNKPNGQIWAAALARSRHVRRPHRTTGGSSCGSARPTTRSTRPPPRHSPSPSVNTSRRRPNNRRPIKTDRPATTTHHRHLPAAPRRSACRFRCRRILDDAPALTAANVDLNA